ncbi:hypothetical protein CUC00_12120 [Prevotella intermedia]|uniref:hypothetical protein n=1 Tax=Prevotella intermedia TaxID=28131 RepID=UPI000C1C3D35|nr:hypothetical protein [Prevotella intermedia]ATV34354.1 hypothetical protein CTM44_11255 [Prevotella intermedia]ATV41811.1 hypothetical protein CUC00_12120 [Prevotella intermedia]
MNALQNLLFCIPKAAVLHGKSVGFAMQKSRFRNAKTKIVFFLRTIFTKQGRFLGFNGAVFGF